MTLRLAQTPTGAVQDAGLLVLFDWNGTLVDDTEHALTATNIVLRSFDRQALDQDSFTEQWKLPVRAFLSNVGIKEAFLAAAHNQWDEAMRQQPTPPLRTHTAKVLRQLHEQGARLGVVSALSERSLHQALNEHRLTDIFDTVCAGVADKQAALTDQLGRHRPAVYVGDSEYDMACAKAAMYLAVGVAGGYTPAVHLQRAGADVILDSFEHLPHFIATLFLAAQPTPTTDRQE